MEIKSEAIPDDHRWWRIADPAWTNPLDPDFARRHGGRWNPKDSFATLYLNEDIVTARMNLRTFIGDEPFRPEDLRDHAAPILVGCVLPRGRIVCDAHTPAGIRALGLPDSYPLEDNSLIPHARCQPIGTRVKQAGLDGVKARSARSPGGAGRELAWFPASAASVARRVQVLAYGTWYWG